MSTRSPLLAGRAASPDFSNWSRIFFGGKELTTAFHIDDAVAHGTAVYAAVLTGSQAPMLDDLLLLGVAPHSIGIGSEGGVMTPIIKRNTTIPTTKPHRFCTEKDNQTHLSVPVCYGESAHAKGNTMIGILEITGLPPAPRGVSQVENYFDIEQRGTLYVRKASGTDPMITVTFHLYRPPNGEMGRMVREFESYKSVDERDVADFRRMRTSFD